MTSLLCLLVGFNIYPNEIPPFITTPYSVFMCSTKDRDMKNISHFPRYVKSQRRYIDIRLYFNKHLYPVVVVVSFIITCCYAAEESTLDNRIITSTTLP